MKKIFFLINTEDAVFIGLFGFFFISLILVYTIISKRDGFEKHDTLISVVWFIFVITILTKYMPAIIILGISLLIYYFGKNSSNKKNCENNHKEFHYSLINESWKENRTSYHVMKCEKCGRKWIKKVESKRIKGNLG